MALSEGDGGRSWWEDNATLVSVMVGLPVFGLTIIGVLTLIGINTSDFPYMISADFFCGGSLPKIAYSPNRVYCDSGSLAKYGQRVTSYDEWINKVSIVYATDYVTQLYL